MAFRRTGYLALLLVLLIASVTGHKKHRRGLHTHETHRNVREDGQSVTCPPPLDVLKIHSETENIAGLINEGGLANLIYMCGTTQVPYQDPSKWVMRELPDGSKVNVTLYEKKYRMVPLCCPGYTRNDNDVCVPKCKGNCTNGMCISPNNCACYQGYALNTLGDCIITCPCGCPNGQCRGDTCVCKPQYALYSNGVCNPECINECVNGDCSAPNVCTCHFGYKKKKNQDSHICSPQCSLPCENGKCVAPDVCVCNNGYEREENTGLCTPTCYNCDHGDCVAPYTCHCHQGYKRENQHCAPVCQGGCYNATCTAPEVCTCFDGFKHTTPHVCVPTCSPACENAQCVAPNNCECHPGFIKKVSSDHKCVSLSVKHR